MSNRQSHRKNKPQRDRSHKRYVPKHINLPVMKGLRDEFGMVLHSALAAAERGHFSKEQYDRIGQALNCIWGALELRPLKDSAAAKLVIEGAMRAMNDAGRRGDASGIWVLRELEQVAVLAGIQKAEELLPRMDVYTLNDAIQRLKVMQIEEERDAKKVFFKSRSVDVSEIQNITVVEVDKNNQPIRSLKIVRGEEERTTA